MQGGGKKPDADENIPTLPPPQISLLKQSLELQLSQSQAALQQLQQQFSQERERLSLQLGELRREHQRREQRLQDAHCCALSTLEDARQQHIRVGHSDRKSVV